MFTFTKMTVNNLVEPIGIDTTPIFGFSCKSDTNGDCQTAYQITVSSPNGRAADMFDSGRVDSTANTDILYKGLPLNTASVYYWQITVWAESGIYKSPISCFETGLLNQSDWSGHYISAAEDKDAAISAPILRKTFSIDPNKSIERVRAYIICAGYADVSISGRRLDSYYNASHTRYDKRILYTSADVTESVKSGNNVIVAELGNGFFNEQTQNSWDWHISSWRMQPSLLMELWVTYADGSIDKTVTDESWKLYKDGPTTYNSVYFGEHYDANKEIDGLHDVNFIDSDWINASIVSPKCGERKNEAFEPIRMISTERPVEVRKNDAGNWFVVCPTTTAGFIRITQKASKGTSIKITYGERINEHDHVLTNVEIDPYVNKENVPIQTDRYIFKGDENGETFEPKFSYKGFKYVEIEGNLENLSIESIEVISVHNVIEKICDFECSETSFNKLHENMVRTILNNCHGKPTDTPMYEKNGWTGDANVAAECLLFDLDITAFIKKFIEDMRDCQLDDGMVPIIVPTETWGVENHPVWSSVYTTLHRELIRTTGELKFAENHYTNLKNMMQFYMEYIKGKNYIEDNIGLLCDWVSPIGAETGVPLWGSPEGAALVSTAYVYKSLRDMCEIAEFLNKPTDKELYADFMAILKQKFNEKFYNAEKGIYDAGHFNPIFSRHTTEYRQTSNLLPIAVGLCDDNNKQVVLDNLIEHIKENGYRLDCGIVGARYILPVLSENGYHEVAMKIAVNKAYPGWNYWIANGADTMWEAWELDARSRDHYFLGTIDEWFIKHIAGINNIQNGYTRFDISPKLDADMQKIYLKLTTVKGDIVIDGDFNDGNPILNVEIPFSSTACIYFNGKTTEVGSGVYCIR